MVINRCVEQGIFVILILSREKEHKAMCSTQLSSILAVSDSYLKKILRKLVLAGIVISNPGKDGGFVLSRPLDEISIYDVYCALEGKECELKMSGVGERTFRSVFDAANDAFLAKLRELVLSKLVGNEDYSGGMIDHDYLTELSDEAGFR